MIRSYASHAKDLDIVPVTGGGFSSSPASPYLHGMRIAAYANDGDAFWESWQKAVDHYKAEGERDPAKVVRNRFRSHNLWRRVFKSKVEDEDRARLLSLMTDDEREIVLTAERNLKAYQDMLRRSR